MACGRLLECRGEKIPLHAVGPPFIAPFAFYTEQMMQLRLDKNLPIQLLCLQAQQVAQYVHKGMQIAVGGHLKQSKWTDKTTGQRREALRVMRALANKHALLTKSSPLHLQAICCLRS